MKKLIFTAFTLFSVLLSFGQSDQQPLEKTEKIPDSDWSHIPKWNYIESGKHIVFIKNNLSKLETCEDGLPNFVENYKNSNYAKFNKATEEERKAFFELAKKTYLGATILKTPEDTIGNYVKLIDIPVTDKFVVIATAAVYPQYYLIKSVRRAKENPFDSKKPTIYYEQDKKTPYYYGNDELYSTGQNNKKLLLQNLNTKLYYLLSLRTFEFSFRNCETLAYNAPAEIYKTVPKTLSSKETEILTKYKSIIKSANVHTAIMQGIQKKYITRGYFDERKVNSVDKLAYNKNLSELKVKANKLAEMGRESTCPKDVNINLIKSKLTVDENASLYNINDWNMKYYPIN